MKTWAAIFVALVALSESRESRCEFVFSIEPPHPADHEDVFVRLTNTTGPHCLPPYSSVTTAGNSIVLELSSTDACGSDDYVSDRYYPIGVFSRGIYSLDIQLCVFNPPPFPSGCGSIATLRFEVGEAIRPSVVSTTSRWALLSLMLALIGLAIGRSSDRQR